MREEPRPPLLLGEAPSRRGDRFYRLPLSGPPARVLCQLAGIEPIADGTTYGRWTWALYERFETANLFERYADATPWSAPVARERVRAILDELYRRPVVLLGRRVQVAVESVLEIDSEPFHSWRLVSSTRTRPDSWLHLAAIPHPSGLNRALNDPDERDRCGRTLRGALERAASTA